MKKLLLFYLLVGVFSNFFTQAQPVQPPTKVAILVYPGVELLDFAGPLEVFSLMERAEVFTVAAKPGQLVTMKNMLKITPDYSLENAPQPDILVVPGASPDHISEVTGDEAVIRWIQQTTAGRQLTMSVCTGAYILGKADLLANKTVTTHWAATSMLQQMTPKTTVMEHVRFVEDGNLVTTAGVSAGIDGALRIVSRLRGAKAAQTVARIMEYDKWQPESGLIVGKKPAVPMKKNNTGMMKPTVVKKTPVLKLPASTLSSTIDPVCKMSVATGLADTAQYAGKYYGFCSKICKERFHEHPSAYVKR